MALMSKTKKKVKMAKEEENFRSLTLIEQAVEI